MTPRYLPALILTSLAGGCAAGAIPRVNAPPVSAAPSTVVKPVQNNSLIGNSPDALARLFGKPRIDVTEGAARKLQFAGSSCIIDIYFYAPRAGAQPVATHVDARTPDGRGAEIESCTEALRR